MEVSPPRFGQGKTATTVLTNRAKNITIISDSDCPYSLRSRYVPQPYRMGRRPMHNTTLIFEENPPAEIVQPTYTNEFSGLKHNLPYESRPMTCPSLHIPHFDFSLGSQQRFDSTSRATYVKHNTKQPPDIQLDANVNRMKQIIGTDMKQVVTRNSNKNDYQSSYSIIHNTLGLRRGKGYPRPHQPGDKYNILTGEVLGPEETKDYHRISGNRVLLPLRRSDTLILS